MVKTRHINKNKYLITSGTAVLYYSRSTGFDLKPNWISTNFNLLKKCNKLKLILFVNFWELISVDYDVVWLLISIAFLANYADYIINKLVFKSNYGCIWVYLSVKILPNIPSAKIWCLGENLSSNSIRFIKIY